MRNAPDPIDIKVGQNVRRLRKAQGLSQTKLGEAIGITFQQVQKYERGTNRMGSSRLVAIARKLEASITDLFEGAVPDEDHRGVDEQIICHAQAITRLTKSRGQPDLKVAA